LSPSEDLLEDLAGHRERWLRVSTWHGHFWSLPGGEPGDMSEWTHETQTELMLGGELTRRTTFNVTGETDEGIVSVAIASASHEYTFPDQTDQFLRVTGARSSGGFTFNRCGGVLADSEVNFVFTAQFRPPDDPSLAWSPVTLNLTNTLNRL
jgi:hypothetical protein